MLSLLLDKIVLSNYKMEIYYKKLKPSFLTDVVQSRQLLVVSVPNYKNHFAIFVRFLLMISSLKIGVLSILNFQFLAFL